MEFVLILDRPLSLEGATKSKVYRGERYFKRSTDDYEVPVTAKLVEDLKSHGVPTSLVIDQQLPGPRLGVAFSFKKPPATDKSSNEDEDPEIIDKGYITVEGLNKFARSVVNGARAGWDIKIRLDVSRIGNGPLVNIQDDAEEGFAKPCPTTGTYMFTVNKAFRRTIHIRPLQIIASWEANVLAESWTANYVGYEGELTVSLTVMCCPIVSLDPEVPYFSAFIKKMLTEELSMDVKIIAGNGAEIKAHRCFLMAHSSVFNAMFQNDMTEARTGILELREMSEESVRALLEFLYVQKRTAAEENPLVCVELLEAGHKYDIQPILENFMKNILLQKSPEWFTPDAVLTLLLFVKDTHFKDLRNKAVQLLKSMRKEVMSLPAFQKLCEENEKCEDELFNYLTTV